MIPTYFLFLGSAYGIKRLTLTVVYDWIWFIVPIMTILGLLIN